MKTIKIYLIPFILVLLLFSCATKNKTREMREVSVFGNYRVKIPITAILVKANRWKIESSSSFLTIIRVCC